MSHSPRHPNRRDSALARWLEPLAAGLWVMFLLCTVAVAAVGISGFGDAEIRQLAAKLSPSPGAREIVVGPSGSEPMPELQTALRWLVGNLPGFWLLLAGTNIYLSLAASDGLSTARRWTATVLGGGLLFTALSSWTGWPQGPVFFPAPNPLGMKIGPVPIGVGLLWTVVILGGRELLLRLAPRASHAQVALGAGALALLSDLNLEPVAWRTFWVWHPGLLPTHPPLQNYATWLICGAALAFLLRERAVVRSTATRPWRPAAVFLAFNGALLVANAARLFAR